MRIPGSMIQPLLTTKLILPPLRQRLVSRPRLHALLDKAIQPEHCLALITAPPGYGKTTLLVDWTKTQHESKRPSPTVCWVSLDEADNDLVRFLGYLAEGMKSILSEEQVQSCRSILANISTPTRLDTQGFLIALLNQVAGMDRLVIIILDDYHNIQDAAVHQAVQFILRSLPPNLHLFIASRSDPPLGLAQLRARGQLVEIRMADLEFSTPETGDFLNKMMDLDLSAEDITALHYRTEGWAAGLQMAAVAIQSPALAKPQQRAAFIQDFSGSSKYVLEYLTEEVFNQQPEAVQTFLMCTSVLERMNGPLCDAVLRGTEMAQAGKTAWIQFALPTALSGQDFLERLDHDNLMVVPLDAEHRWFRYHPLFAELLKGKLKHQHPGCAEILLARAARWNEKQGNVVEAIAQGLASGNVPLTSEMLERHVLSFFYQSEIAQVQRWLNALPGEVLRSRPLLCAVNAAVTALLPPYPPRSLELAEPSMQAAETTLSKNPGEHILARAFALKIRSYWARFQGQTADQVISLINQALALLPEEVTDEASDRDRIRSALLTNLTLTYWDNGDETTARQVLREARLVSRAAGDLFNESSCIYIEAIMRCLNGQLNEAAGLCREGLDYFASRMPSLGHRTPFSGEIGVQLGEILIEQNRLAEAEPIIRDNMALARWTMSHNILVRGGLALARLLAMQADYKEAFSSLDEVAAVSSMGKHLASALRARLWIGMRWDHPESLDLARQWAREHSLQAFDRTPPQVHWETSLVLARLQLAEAQEDRSRPSGELETSLEWLVQQQRSLSARGWAHWQIRLGVLESLVLEQMGDRTAALEALKRCLGMSEHGDYIRVYVDEGDPLRRLLLQVKETDFAYPTYINTIMTAFPKNHAAPELPPDMKGFAEPLTTRELEVLCLIAQGYSNQEIASRLVITLNTVKKHNYSIFQKLGVTNRAQAILAARDAGLA